MLKRFGRETRGQSLVEVALALPILLMLVLGIADLGRVAYYSIAVTHAARDAAAYAAQDVKVNDLQVQKRVCGELKPDDATCTGLSVQCTRGFTPTCNAGTAAPTVRVSVHYDLPLLTGIIANRFGISAIPLRGQSTFAGYAQ